MERKELKEKEIERIIKKRRRERKRRRGRK